MPEPAEERVVAAVERASNAFWITFADQFPETKSGDLDPLSTVAFDDAVDRAAREWLSLNWPGRAASST